MPIGTFIDTRTLSVTGTASGSITHGLSTSPHMVWATAKRRNAAFTTGYQPYFTASFNSASVSVFNRGRSNETWTVCSAFLHSLIR